MWSCRVARLGPTSASAMGAPVIPGPFAFSRRLEAHAPARPCVISGWPLPDTGAPTKRTYELLIGSRQVPTPEKLRSKIALKSLILKVEATPGIEPG